MNRDYSDMLSALNAEGVEYLLVGGHALAAHGLPRATRDIDLWVRPTVANAARVLRALARFGAPPGDLTSEDLARKGTVYQVGVAPQRIDILTMIDGVEFDEAWAGRTAIRIGDLNVPVIGRNALLQNKRASGRPQDLADVAHLEAKR